MHRKTEAARENKTQSCETPLKALYSSKNDLSHYDRQILDIPRDKMLQQPTQILNRRLNANEPYVQNRTGPLLSILHVN